MNVDNHRHCQATVLGATGEPHGNGLTWNEINNGSFPNIDAIYSDWRNILFSRNDNMTQDLAGILALINQLAQPISFPTSEAGDLISIVQNSNGNNVIKVRNNISNGYSSVVGITSGNQETRMLKECPIWVENIDPNANVIAYLHVGDQTIPITANIQQSPEPEPDDNPRYIITEDTVYDIMLSGGVNDNCPLDYTDELRYVVTENGHEYDIGVSGYGDGVILNYNED